MDLTSSFRYLSPAGAALRGVDALSNLKREAQRLEAKRAFIVCSETVARTTNLLERTREELGELYAGSYDGAKRESPIPLVMAGVEAAKAAQADMIVAVGGGSAVVTARAITILMAENGTPQELCTKYPPGQPPVSPRLMQPKVPNVLVLTTPTNGANRGGAAVMDDKPPYRLELFDPKARPACIILDGEALLTAPLPLFLDTATNTFTAVVGGLQSPNLNPFAYADLRQALELSLEYLPRLVADPDDLKPRIQLGAAAIISNRAADAPSAGNTGRCHHPGPADKVSLLPRGTGGVQRGAADHGHAPQPGGGAGGPGAAGGAYGREEVRLVRRRGRGGGDPGGGQLPAVHWRGVPDKRPERAGSPTLRPSPVTTPPSPPSARPPAAWPKNTDVAELTRFLQEAW